MPNVQLYKNAKCKRYAGISNEQNIQIHNHKCRSLSVVLGIQSDDLVCLHMIQHFCNTLKEKNPACEIHAQVISLQKQHESQCCAESLMAAEPVSAF